MKRDETELITDILSALARKDHTTRYELTHSVYTHHRTITTTLHRMCGHELISMDHLGISLTDKGREALRLYNGLCDMVRIGKPEKNIGQPVWFTN